MTTVPRDARSGLGVLGFRVLGFRVLGFCDFRDFLFSGFRGCFEYSMGSSLS